MRAKRDTRDGFAPHFRINALQVERSQELARLDGSFERFVVHDEWARQLRCEAYLHNALASSAIEGNPLGVHEARHALEDSHDAMRRVHIHEQEIIQHVAWYRRLDRLDPLTLPDIGIDEIRESQRSLLDGVLPAAYVGTLRGVDIDAEVVLGGFEGTPAKNVTAELDHLAHWFHGAGRILPAPVRIAVWVLEFLAIHPFADGNGRTARALTQRLLRAEGLIHAKYVALDRSFNEDRPGYYAALNEGHLGNTAAWVDHFLTCLHEAYRAAARTYDALADLAQPLTGVDRAIVE